MDTKSKLDILGDDDGKDSCIDNLNLFPENMRTCSRQKRSGPTGTSFASKETSNRPHHDPHRSLTEITPARSRLRASAHSEPGERALSDSLFLFFFRLFLLARAKRLMLFHRDVSSTSIRAQRLYPRKEKRFE